MTYRRLPFQIRPISTAVEMHLIEHAFGQIYDLHRRLEIAAVRLPSASQRRQGRRWQRYGPRLPRPPVQVDDPVHLRDGAHVVFNDFDGIAGVYEALQVLHQPVAIGG